jgi:hypothetical protein
MIKRMTMKDIGEFRIEEFPISRISTIDIGIAGYLLKEDMDYPEFFIY